MRRQPSSATFAVTVRSPVAVVLALALAGGALFPPLTAVVRVAWASTWPDRDRRDAGLSLDTVIVELTSIAVPPATAVLVTGAGMATAVVVLLGWLAVAVLLMPVSRPAYGGTVVHATRRSRPLGPLASPTIRVLVLTGVIAGGVMAATTIPLIAVFVAREHAGASGLIVGGLAVGSVVGSLAYGAWGKLIPARWGIALLGALGVGCIVAVSPLAGLAIGPAYTALTSLAGVLAPPGSATETQAWINGSYALGSALGTTVAATINDATPTLLGAAALAFTAAAAWRLIAARDHDATRRHDRASPVGEPTPNSPPG